MDMFSEKVSERISLMNLLLENTIKSRGGYAWGQHGGFPHFFPDWLRIS